MNSTTVYMRKRWAQFKNRSMKLCSLIILIFSISIAHSQNPKYLDFGKDEVCNSLMHISETEYLLAGNHGETAFFCRINDNLDTLWTTFISDTCYIYDICYSQNSGIGIAGFSSNGIKIIKADISGNILWSKDYEGGIKGLGYSIVECEDGFIATGQVRPNSPDNSDVIIFRVNASGTVIWRKVYDYGSMDWGYSLKATSDGNFILAGLASDGRFLTTKFNANGDTTFNRKYGIGYYGYGSSDIIELNDGFILCGIGLMKISLNGDSLWYNSIGGGYKMVQQGNSIFAISWEPSDWDNDLQIVLKKHDLLGNLIWKKIYAYGNDDWGYAIESTKSGGILLSGKTRCETCPNSDIIFIIVNADGIVTGIENYDFKSERIKFYNNKISLSDIPEGTMRLYNLNGILMGTYKIDAYTNSVELDLNHLLRGIYVYVFITEKNIIDSGKILIK